MSTKMTTMTTKTTTMTTKMKTTTTMTTIMATTTTTMTMTTTTTTTTTKMKTTVTSKMTATTTTTTLKTMTLTTTMTTTTTTATATTNDDDDDQSLRLLSFLRSFETMDKKKVNDAVFKKEAFVTISNGRRLLKSSSLIEKLSNSSEYFSVCQGRFELWKGQTFKRSNLKEHKPKDLRR